MLGVTQLLAGDIDGHLDDLQDFALPVEHRIVRPLDPDIATTLGDAMILASLKLSATKFVPECGVFGAGCVVSRHEQAMVLTAHLIARIAHGSAEILVRIQDSALPIELNDRE